MDIDIRLLPPAEKYLKNLSSSEQSLIAADIKEMRNGNFVEVRTKQLKGSVRELISGHHRFSYFQIGNTIFLVRGFRKKSTKTPRTEIEYAERTYKIIRNKL